MGLLYRRLQLELGREPGNRNNVLAVLNEHTVLSEEQAEDVASLLWFMQDKLDDAAKTCDDLRNKVWELRRREK